VDNVTVTSEGTGEDLTVGPGEYDCLIAPLLTRLARHNNRAGLSEYLWYEMEDHFSLDPARYGTDHFADNSPGPGRACRAVPARERLRCRSGRDHYFRAHLPAGLGPGRRCRARPRPAGRMNLTAAP
jgi:hypothetical protein